MYKYNLKCQVRSGASRSDCPARPMLESLSIKRRSCSFHVRIGAQGGHVRLHRFGSEPRRPLRADGQMSMVVGERVGGAIHTIRESRSSGAPRQYVTRPRSAAGPVWVMQVDPFEQIAELRRTDRHRPVGRQRPRKRPRSSRLVNRHAPWPLCQNIFRRSPLRLRKQNR